MAFAGLWEGVKWPVGAVLRTFPIITTNTNATVGELHDRMPVILEPQDWQTRAGE
jgi:putative SOS response-associated peptidase YedK